MVRAPNADTGEDKEKTLVAAARLHAQVAGAIRLWNSRQSIGQLSLIPIPNKRIVIADGGEIRKVGT